MPLLGRNKPPLSGAGSQSTPNASTASRQTTTPSSSSSNSRQQQQSPTCESPLFGVRKQLALGALAQSAQARTSSSPAAANDESAQAAEIPQQISRQQIHYAFSMMDTNKDGMIDLRELSQMLANLGVPIDEAVLSHVICGVSKRGERRISEADFLDWISHFIQITTSEPAPGGNKTARAAQPARPTSSQSPSRSSVGRSSRQRVARSSTAGSSLTAQPSGADLPLINRNRRGSGSGLALMRSLSSGAKAAGGGGPSADEGRPAAFAAGSGGASAGNSTNNTNSNSKGTGSRRQGPPPPAELSADSEARNDLRAAFGVFDIDGDGFITLDEVRAGLKLLGESWSQTELKQLFAKCTTNGQRISIDDFVKLLL